MRHPSESSPAGHQEDAISMLVADHREVRELFDEFDRLIDDEAEDDERAMLASQICLLLIIHATVEEEMFYPAARAALGGRQDLVDEALVEHEIAKALIAQIIGMQGNEPLFDATVRVLGQYVAHHVHEEETEIFPKLRKTGLDLASIGHQIATRKAELADGFVAAA